MWKKVMYLTAGILALLVLVTGVVTAVNADDGPKGDGAPNVAFGPGGPGGQWGPGAPGVPSGGDMLGRVARILNIDKQKLDDAFKQAGAEMEQQRTNDMFASWVSAGKLKQEQADQYKTWLAAKPDGAPGFVPFDSTKSTGFLDRLLKDGRINQAQYDAHKAWISQKPNVELPKPERPAGVPSDNATRPFCPPGAR